MPTRPIATKIVSTLQRNGFIAYFAGGWVRDYLLGKPSADIDIATTASVEDIQRLFPKTIPVGIAFGIVVVVEEGHPFEIATFRKESEHLDGRRPERIETATPEEDAQRRDFTINGLFFDPTTEAIFDYVDGIADIKKGLIKAIGDPHQRFSEDRLRMIRAVRYAIRFHFPIDPDTEKAIRAHAKELFPSVSIERVWQEFQKMSHFSDFYKALEQLYTLGLLSIIFPKLAEIPFKELQKRLLPFRSFPEKIPLILELLHLFPFDSLEEHLSLCDYLKLSKKEKELVLFFHKAKALLTKSPEEQKTIENHEWAQFYAHPLSTLCLSLFYAPISFHLENQNKLAPFVFRMQTNTPLIKAEDLQKEGILPSPKLGRLLQEAERISLNKLLSDKQAIISLLKKSSLWTE